MSDRLDNRIIELIADAFQDSRDTTLLVAQIRQAFESEEYRTISPDTKTIYAPTIENDRRTFMTGQEWYERFKTELDKAPQWGDDKGIAVYVDEALYAAKKAANLPEDKS